MPDVVYPFEVEELAALGAINLHATLLLLTGLPPNPYIEVEDRVTVHPSASDGKGNGKRSE